MFDYLTKMFENVHLDCVALIIPDFQFIIPLK